MAGGNKAIKSKSQKNTKKFKCPYFERCGVRLERQKLPAHVEKVHSDLIPEGYTANRVVFNSINKKDHGTCTICGKESPWNEDKCRYERLCGDPKCTERYTQITAERLYNVRGCTKEDLLNDPEFQNQMLANRRISGTYKFSDGTEMNYVGSYERSFLEFMDVYFNIDTKDLIQPGPVIPYKFKGEDKKWITDFYYEPYNLVFDIKDGGDNPNTRDMPEYRAKQTAKEAAIEKQGIYNYIRLTNNNFDQMIELMMELKLSMMETPCGTAVKPIVRINEAISDKMIEDIGERSKQRFQLGSYRRMMLNDTVVRQYVHIYPSMRGLHINKHTKGYMWTDNSNSLVGYINVESKPDGHWITNFEVAKQYRDHGLSSQILDVAVKSLKADHLTVRKDDDNDIAINVFKKYGFKSYKETADTLYMSIGGENDSDDWGEDEFD